MWPSSQIGYHTETLALPGPPTKTSQSTVNIYLATTTTPPDFKCTTPPKPGRSGKRSGLAGLSRHGQPAVALVVVLGIILANLVAEQLVGEPVVNATFSALQVGTVVLLVAYVMAVAGAIWFLFLHGEAKAPMWQILVPIVGGAFVLYTIYRNVFVGQTGYYAHTQYIEGGWLLVGLGVVCLLPGLAARVRSGLAAGHAP